MLKLRNICFSLLLFFTIKSSYSQCLFYFFSNDYNCITNQAIATFTISGNIAPYTCTFVNVLSQTVAVGSAPVSTGSVNGLATGPYTVYVSSAGGCTATVQFNITIPFSSGNVVFTSTMVSCNGGNNGTTFANIIGGGLVAPYTYTWSTGSFSPGISNLTAGTYSVTIKDVNNCAVTNSVTITQPPPIFSTLLNTVTACYGGTLSSVITTTGGTAPFSYTVNGLAVPGNTATGLSAGINTIITSDFKGCIKTNTVNVVNASPPIITFSVTKPSCPNSTNGAVNALVSNAPPGLTYTWQPLASFTSTLNNVSVGNYTLTIKDGNACTTSSVVTVTSLVNLNSNVLTNSENCSASDGAFTINITGGNSPYTYSTVGFGVHLNNSVGGLSSGAYTTIVTDASNCSDTVKFVIGNLSTVSVSVLSSNSVQCYGQCNGSVTLGVVNGVPPITYSATGTPTTSSNMITNLCAGPITIKVIDNLGCPATTTINFPIPPVFSYSAANPPPICYGKTFSLQANASGGVGSYNYMWNPGNLTGQIITLTSTATTVYSLNVYDSNGCTMAPFMVTVNVNPLITVNLNSSNSGICPGTTAQISPTITGGDGNYTFNWLPGNITSSSIYVESITVPVYTLFVNDACGSPTAVKEITINLFPKITPTFSLSSNNGCEPFCTNFINTTPKATNVIWNYGDRPFEAIGETTRYCYEKNGVFNVRLTVNDSNACKTSYTYSSAINVLKKPSPSFKTDPAIITSNELDNVKFINTTNNGSQFFWSVNGEYFSSSKDITYSFNDTGCVNFRLIAISNDNCIDTLETNVCAIEGFNFWMPNAFSPDNDGKNDVFMPKGTAWKDEGYIFEVYNRWGKRIFKTNDVSGFWDGKTKGDEDPLNQYFWHVRITDILNEVHDLKGFVLLLK